MSYNRNSHSQRNAWEITNAWAGATVHASEREDSVFQKGYKGVSRKSVHIVATFKNRKAVGADQIVNELTKYGGGMLTMMVKLFNCISKNEYEPRRWRKGVVVNSRKETRPTRGNIEGKRYQASSIDRMGTI